MVRSPIRRPLLVLLHWAGVTEVSRVVFGVCRTVPLLGLVSCVAICVAIMIAWHFRSAMMHVGRVI